MSISLIATSPPSDVTCAPLNPTRLRQPARNDSGRPGSARGFHRRPGGYGGQEPRGTSFNPQ